MPPRLSPLEAHAASMAKKYGDRAVTAPPAPYEVISSGSLGVDHILHKGGWPVGRIYELLGPPDVSKTTLMICSMREQQKARPDRGICYIDMEKTFDYDWAALLGLDCSEEAIRSGRWLHLYPGTSEEASDMARDQIKTGLFSCAVVDSIGGMESKKALDKEAEDTMVGANAQVITRMVKHLATLTRQYHATVFLVNQPRKVISSRAMSDVSAGPNAMQHQTTVKIQLSKGPDEPRKMVLEPGQDPEPVAVQFKARVVRSKIAPPGRTCEYWVFNRFTESAEPGIFALDEYADLGIRTGAIKQDSSWYTFPAGHKVQGRESVYAAMRARPELMAEIRAAMFPEQQS